MSLYFFNLHTTAAIICNATPLCATGMKGDIHVTMFCSIIEHLSFFLCVLCSVCVEFDAYIRWDSYPHTQWLILPFIAQSIANIILISSCQNLSTILLYDNKIKDEVQQNSQHHPYQNNGWWSNHCSVAGTTTRRCKNNTQMNNFNCHYWFFW